MTEAMPWWVSWRADPRARLLADAHYNRQSPGAAQFVPPGSCMVLLTADAGALWVTSWPLAEYVAHDWAGAWVNTTFRRETGPLASSLITAAVAATQAVLGEPPPLGMVTFIDRTKIRHKRDPGRCYLRAGFKIVGETKYRRLLVLQLTPDEMPEPLEPLGYQRTLTEAGR